jgi:hypothetical protein
LRLSIFSQLLRHGAPQALNLDLSSIASAAKEEPKRHRAVAWRSRVGGKTIGSPLCSSEHCVRLAGISEAEGDNLPTLLGSGIHRFGQWVQWAVGDDPILPRSVM